MEFDTRWARDWGRQEKLHFPMFYILGFNPTMTSKHKTTKRITRTLRFMARFQPLRQAAGNKASARGFGNLELEHYSVCIGFRALNRGEGTRANNIFHIYLQYRLSGTEVVVLFRKKNVQCPQCTLWSHYEEKLTLSNNIDNSLLIH